MGSKVAGKVSGNEEEGGLEPGSGKRIPTTVVRWSGRSPKGSAGLGSSEEGSGWGCGQVPNECRRGIDKRGIDSGNSLGGGKNGKLGDSGGESKEGGLGSYLLSTKTRPVEEHVLHRTPGGRTRLRCW